METKEILGGIQQFAPLADLAVPGLGTGISAATGLINMFVKEPTRYKTLAENNSLAYGGKYNMGGNLDSMVAAYRKLNPTLPTDVLRKMAKGGQLNPVSSTSMEVQADNPNLTDSVELPNAFVDNNEMISMAQGGKYVFSDDLKDPLTGKSFAQLDKKIAMSDAKAEKKANDPEAKNTLKHNSQLRENLASMNDKMRMASGGNMYRYGGKMKYVNGGNSTDPLLSGLQKIANPIFGMPVKYPSIQERSNAGQLGVNVRIPDNLVSAGNGQPQGKNNQLNQQFYRDNPNVRRGVGSGIDLAGIASNPLTYQLGELGAKALLLARGYDKQPRYQVNSPISLRGYDPSNALMQNQYGLNKARRDVSQLGTASDVLNNLQNVYANVNRANADIVSRYDTMNRQAQVDYENRLGQRQAQNIGLNMATDQIRQQDEAAYFNQIYDLLTSVGNYGRAKSGEQTNRQAAELLAQAYPDIAQFMNLNFGG